MIYQKILTTDYMNYLPDSSCPFCVVRLVTELLRDADPVRELPELDAVKTFLPSTFTCVVELFPFTALLISSSTELHKIIRIIVIAYNILYQLYHYSKKILDLKRLFLDNKISNFQKCRYAV